MRATRAFSTAWGISGLACNLQDIVEYKGIEVISYETLTCFLIVGVAVVFFGEFLAMTICQKGWR